MAVTPETLKNFFRTKMGVDTSQVTDETPLFSTSLIDSFGMIELITFLEAEAGIRINPMDVTMENIDTISSIIYFVHDKSDS